MPIPPKPPWYSTPTAIVSLPTAVPISCNSLIESPTDTPATESCENKSYDNIENNNDHPDDDDDDVDCFPRQDKQPVQPQDISPTAPTANNTSPSLIESFTDKSTDPTNTDNMNIDNNNNTNNNDPYGTRTTPTRTKQTAYRGFGPKPMHVWNGERYQKATSPAHAQLIRNIRQKFNEEIADHNNSERPDDDNDNKNDIDCFPQQDKQLVLPPPDIPPTNTLRTNLIESTTTINDDDDDDSTVIHDNRYYDSDYDDDEADDAYINDGYDYDGGWYDDDDDDDSYKYCSSDEDDYYNNNNTPNVIFDMHGNQFTIDDNGNMVPYAYDDKPLTLQAAQRQINAILAGCTTASSITKYTDQAKRENDEFFLPKNTNTDRTRPATPSPAPTKYAKTNNHDAFLYHRWNRSDRHKNTTTINPSTTKPTPAAATTGKTTAYAPIEIPIKDDPSVTPTLETLCTLDTRSSDPTYNDTDVILNITIWNQPIVPYRMPIRPLAATRNRSQHPSTAVLYALIGVYDKPNPSNLPCQSSFTSIICVVLSCFTLLADSFTMVKIDDRYPDEWFD